MGVCPMHKDHIAMGVCPMHNNPEPSLKSVCKKILNRSERVKKCKLERVGSMQLFVQTRESQQPPRPSFDVPQLQGCINEKSPRSIVNVSQIDEIYPCIPNSEIEAVCSSELNFEKVKVCSRFWKPGKQGTCAAACSAKCLCVFHRFKFHQKKIYEFWRSTKKIKNQEKTILEKEKDDFAKMWIAAGLETKESIIENNLRKKKN